MIIGIGNDLIDIRRIERTLKRYGDRFLNRFFTTTEQKVSERRLNRVESYAKRFAAKEAFTKALGTGINKGISLKNIEIFNDSLGKPKIKLRGRVNNFLKRKIKKKKYNIYISLSDDAPWAQATVIISYK